MRSEAVSKAVSRAGYIVYLLPCDVAQGRALQTRVSRFSPLPPSLATTASLNPVPMVIMFWEPKLAPFCRRAILVGSAVFRSYISSVTTHYHPTNYLKGPRRPGFLIQVNRCVEAVLLPTRIPSLVLLRSPSLLIRHLSFSRAPFHFDLP